MSERPERAGVRDLVARPTWLWVWLPLLAITVSHYTTSTAVHWPHDVLRRLYYIPIVIAAFRLGRRGAVVTSGVASLLYLPHAFIHAVEIDPAGTLDKLLEIVLYNVIALITGTLADREHAERRRQEVLAAELRESLEDNRAMEDQLVRSGRLQALGELTAGLAHEIKNPLASMKGATEIVADEIAEGSPRRRMVEVLRKEIDRLTALLERFLAFARPGHVEDVDVDLAGVVEHALALAELRSGAGDRIVWGRDPGDEAIRVRGDAGQLEQVVLNVLLNACEVTPEGGRVEVRLARAARGRRRLGAVTVEDRGPGVPEHLRERVFDPFVTTREGGTGLGLSIAARIVDAHGGLIEMRTRDGGGTSVGVFIPLAAGDPAYPAGRGSVPG